MKKDPKIRLANIKLSRAKIKATLPIQVRSSGHRLIISLPKNLVTYYEVEPLDWLLVDFLELRKQSPDRETEASAT